MNTKDEEVFSSSFRSVSLSRGPPLVVAPPHFEQRHLTPHEQRQTFTPFILSAGWGGGGGEGRGAARRILCARPPSPPSFVLRFFPSTKLSSLRKEPFHTALSLAFGSIEHMALVWYLALALWRNCHHEKKKKRRKNRVVRFNNNIKNCLSVYVFPTTPSVSSNNITFSEYALPGLLSSPPTPLLRCDGRSRPPSVML